MTSGCIEHASGIYAILISMAVFVCFFPLPQVLIWPVLKVLICSGGGGRSTDFCFDRLETLQHEFCRLLKDQCTVQKLLQYFAINNKYFNF